MTRNDTMTNVHTLLKNPKTQLCLLLAALAVTGLVGASVPSRIVIVLTTSVAAALLAEWAFFGAVPSASLQSAAISGAIVGLLVAPGADLLFAWSASVAAIASKKLLVFREGKHIFNPAAFGLVVAMLIFGNRINWWGNTSVVLVILGAGLILIRLRRLSLPFAYFIARLAGIVLLTGPDAGRAMLLLPNLFFAFIMLVEPKTSPGKRGEQWIFGGACGLLATLFYRFFPAFEGDMLALLTINLLRPWMISR
jgi:Na+-translocating ferredoxin:NAD+ oxidoreductase RnfD subunit